MVVVIGYKCNNMKFNKFLVVDEVVYILGKCIQIYYCMDFMKSVLVIYCVFYYIWIYFVSYFVIIDWIDNMRFYSNCSIG